jgi:hypothetical protein
MPHSLEMGGLKDASLANLCVPLPQCMGSRAELGRAKNQFAKTVLLVLQLGEKRSDVEECEKVTLVNNHNN